MIRFLFLFLIYFSLETNAGKHFVAECNILNEDMTPIKSFAGSLCVFLEDGSMIQEIDVGRGLNKISPLGDIIWSRKISLHHQLNLSTDKKTLLALNEEVRSVAGCQSRVDVLWVMDLKTGKTLKSFSVFEHRDEILKKYSGLLYKIKTPRNPEADCEFLHGNAFYEIPPNTSPAEKTGLAAGNFIFTTATDGIFVLDAGLNRILKHYPVRSWTRDAIHDVQVTPEGRFLIYNNSGLYGFPAQTVINLYDPITGIHENIFPKELVQTTRTFEAGKLRIEIENIAKTKSLLFSERSGGVQILDDGLLFNLNVENQGGFAVKTGRDGKIIWQKPLIKHTPLQKHPFFQQVKQLDLEKFLEKNRL